MKRVVCILGCGLGLLWGGRAPSGDITGWELVPKTDKVAQMEVFPEMPVQLPDTTPYPRQAAALAGVDLEKLDRGSLFRRSYSAPTLTAEERVEPEALIDAELDATVARTEHFVRLREP